MKWCPNCKQDVRWAGTGLTRLGACGCAETWVLRITIGRGYKRLNKKRQFLPTSFEIKERPVPLGDAGRA